MAGISIPGLASGLNWQTLVTSLMNAEAAPETTWTNQQTANTTKVTALNQVQTDLTAFQSAATAISSGAAFTSRSATLSGSGWSASAEPGTADGQYSFNVTSVATQAQLEGSTGVAAPLSSTSVVSGLTFPTMSISLPVTAGTFTVDGQEITVNSTDTLQSIFDKIAAATQEAVTASYNPSTDEVSLNSSSPIVLGSGSDTSNFLAAMKLYSNGGDSVSSTSSLAVVNTNASIANANLASAVTDTDSNGNGSFSINGVSINFNVSTDSIQAVMNRINASAAGVTASYNPTTDSFTLINNATGNTNISVSEASGGLLQALGLNSTATVVPGTNAQVSVNDGPTLTSTSNTFDSSLTGIQGLSVTASSLGEQTATVASDTSDATTQINSFISAYNTLQSYIDSQTTNTTSSTGAVTLGTLADDSGVSDFATSLRNMMFNPISGLTGSIQSLNNIGIGFTGTSSQLSIVDPTALSQALASDPSGVQALFTSQPGGLVSQINNFVTESNSPSGLVPAETANLTAQNNTLGDQITALKAKVASDTTNLTNEFVAMENAISSIQTESQTLNSFFGSQTTSSGSGSDSSSSSSSTGSSSSTSSTSSTSS